MRNTIRKFLELPANARALLLVQLVICSGSFIVIPYLAVYLTTSLSLGATFVALQLTVKLLTQRGGMVPGGILADRIGALPVIIIGLLCRVASYVVYVFAPATWTITLASFLLGASAALFTPASKKLFATMAKDDEKVLIFSLRSVVNNLGVALGGGFGALLANLPPGYFFLLAGVLQLVAIIPLFSQWDGEKKQDASGDKKRVAGSIEWKNVAALLIHPAYMSLMFICFGYNVLYVQLEITLPLYVNDAFSKSAVGGVFIVNALVVILTQVPLNLYMHKWFSPFSVITVGFLASAVGLGGLGFQPFLPLVYVLIGVYTLGELFIDPTLDARTAGIVGDRLAGTAYGLLGLAAMAGGAVGSISGSYIYSSWSGTALWGAACLFALFAALATFLLGRKTK
jgi:predicted MFS family arabinose efflux permease